jgi:hypothetical protein
LLVSLVKVVNNRANEVRNYHLDVRNGDADTPLLEWWYSTPSERE